ncbi:hypothetical protein M0805_001200 [Coniferiporia weirii]|nr:hypothetical protein M0805_001200 [Coniferiporia weirii]
MSPFPNAFYLSGHLRKPNPRALAELLMVKLSASIRSKPDWWVKYKDPNIRAKWREEALATKMVWIERATMLVPYEGAREMFPGAVFPGAATLNSFTFDESVVQLNEKQTEYVLDELDGYAKLRDEETGIQVSSFDGIWHSDTLIDGSLREVIKKGITALEDVPDSQKDWHPGSDDQVLDLVHPSLYCVVYGRTLAYPSGSDPHAHSSADLKPLPSPSLSISGFSSMRLKSRKFQWLPTDFAVAGDGTVKGVGYINNLHPSHEKLYGGIERVLGVFIPLFERVLTDMLHPLPTRIPDDYEALEDCGPAFLRPPDSRDEGEDDSDVDYYQRFLDYVEGAWNDDPIVGLPDVNDYAGDLEARHTTVSLRGRTIQVIVKLANIQLTPEKPEYKGGSWHVEGMAHEHIVASGLYYYDQENITQSDLAFRIAVDDPHRATQGQAESDYDYYAHYKTWGMVMDYQDSTNLTNVVGATTTSQDRCLAFPNTYQHRVSPFALADRSQPGHRKLLALFLIDPNIAPIPSTTIVPPQQREWALRALRETDARAPVGKLPVEILDEVVEKTGLMTDEEAKALRLELMEERTLIKKGGYEKIEQETWFSGKFNLCEH